MEFAGEVAIVTGGASGIGAAVVRKLAEKGATCVIFSRNPDKAERVISSLQEKTVRFLAVDVTDPLAVKQAVDRVGEWYGRIDMLVNCAGINNRKAALEYSLAEWREIIDTNLTGTFLVSQHVASRMKEQGGGRIVNIGSMTSHYGVPNVAAYAAAKGGVMQLTKALAVEWARYQIRVNQVSPGYVDTALAKQVLSNEPYRRRLIERTPQGRLGTPEDIAKVVICLLSNETAFVTGQIVGVDGGILGGDPTLDPLQF